MSTRSSHSAAQLRVELRGSRTFCVALSLLAGAALCAIAVTALPAVLRLILAAAVLVRLVFLLRRERALRGLLSWRDGYWYWIDTDGECPLQLCAATLWPGLIVIRMRERAGGRGRVFTLLADSADRDAQRQLRVCLRHMPVFDLPEGG